MNNTPNPNKIQPNSRRELLDQSRLSQFPKRDNLSTFDNPPTSQPAVVAVCAGCGERLDLDDSIQKTFTGCRRCISIYGRLDAAFDENSKRKKKEMLGKMVGGAK